MRKRLSNNIGLKIISLVFACLLWFAIVNIDDPVNTKQYTNVPVKAQNENMITNDGKIYQVLNDTNTVTVTVTAKRSILKNIGKDDISAVADMKNIQLNSLVPITITIPAYEGKYESVASSPLNMQISIEENESVKLPITVTTTGTPRDGYFVESTNVSPDNVTVSGPKSIIDSIASAVVNVSVSGISSTSSFDGTLNFYDSRNNLIDDTLLTENVGTEGITVTVNVLQTKEVPVSVSVSGDPANGYEYVSVSSEPEYVTIMGKQERLDKIDEIKIPGEAVSIAGASATVETVVDISNYLPEGISLADAKTNKVLVTAVIESYGTKTVNYPVGSIQVQNAPDGYKLTYQDTGDLSLKFQGSTEDLAKLSSGSLTASIDMTGIVGEGTHVVTVNITPPSGCTLVSDAKVTVVLTKNQT